MLSYISAQREQDVQLINMLLTHTTDTQALHFHPGTTEVKRSEFTQLPGPSRAGAPMWRGASRDLHGKPSNARVRAQPLALPRVQRHFCE